MSRLNTYSRQASGIPPGQTQFMKIDSIPNGIYTFGIVSAQLKELDIGDVLTMKLKVLDGVAAGKEVDYDNWLTGQDKETKEINLSDRAVGRLKEELTILGFPWENWSPDHWFEELGRQTPSLRGLCFQGEKYTNNSGSKTYHNLKFVKKVPPPAKGAAPPPSNEEPIPF